MHNLIGKIFKRLKVISKANKPIGSNSGEQFWLCVCDCGNTAVVRSYSLLCGDTTSCGCFHKEQLTKIRKPNTFDLTNGFGIGYISKDKEFYFDLEDYEKISKYSWNMNAYGYIVSYSEYEESKKILWLHNIIMDKNIGDKKIEVDHINHQRNDNRKENLRLASRPENTRNSSIRKNNTSGFIGITFDKKNNKWVAQITIDGKNKKIGRYYNLFDAVAARLVAEKKFFGEFAPQKNLFSEYRIE